MRPDLTRTSNVLRASFWLALSWLVLVSPSFSQTEQWTRLDDKRQPAAQATPPIAAVAARPQGDDGATVALGADPQAAQDGGSAAISEVASYSCARFASAAAFDPRAPPLS